MEKFQLTKEGVSKLEAEYRHLLDVERPAITKELVEARALGDLSENAEYDAARNEQALVENRIQELEAMIENVVIIENVATDKVSIGNKVTIEYVGDNDTEEYSIVGSKEADPFNKKISNESPIAQAIMGKKTGDIVSVESPNGKYDVRIVSIA